MQSNAARVMVAVGSVAAIVVLFVVLSGGDDDRTDTTTTAAETATTAPGETDQRPTQPPKPPKPEVDKIVVDGSGQPKAGVADLSYAKGDRVRLEVDSAIAEEVHVHGYDLTEDVPAGGKAKFSFVADIDGVFEIELEQSAVQLAQLTVKP